MDTRRFALIWGIAFLLFGVLGFVPMATPMHGPHDGLSVGGPGHGYLLGLFHVNLLHNIIHLLFGVMGVLAARGLAAARAYARLVAVSYLLLAVMGLISAFNINNTFSLVPIHGNDVWLHLLLAAPAFYFGFLRPAANAASHADTYNAPTTSRRV